MAAGCGGGGGVNTKLFSPVDVQAAGVVIAAGGVDDIGAGVGCRLAIGLTNIYIVIRIVTC